MEKRGQIFALFLIFTFLFILLVPDVRANFVCGQVLGDGVNPTWFDVTVRYAGYPKNTTVCQISPEGRYCCDPREIEQVQWELGRVVEASVFDRGYVAGPVNLSISGEGYDIFPDMQLERVLKVVQPNRSVFVGENGFFVHFSSSFPYTELRYELNGSVFREGGCVDCTNFEELLENLEFGMYELKLFASDGVEEVVEKHTLTLLESVRFSRQLECDGCRRNHVRSGEEVRVSVFAEFSHPVEGTFFDRFPNDWEFLGGGDLVEFSETHSVVEWDVSGSRAEGVYTLRAPRTFFTRLYAFQNGFESLLDFRSKIVLYRFYRFLGIPAYYQQTLPGRVYYEEFETGSGDHPLVLTFEDRDLIQIAVFPSKEVVEPWVFVLKRSPARLRGAYAHFVLGSSVADSEVDSVFIKFKVDKGSFFRPVLSASLFYFDSQRDGWEEVVVTLSDEDENYLYYEARASMKGAFALQKERGWFRR